MDVMAYARQLKQLLPPGSLWNLLPSSTLSKLLQSLAEELTRVDARGGVLVEESDPRTAEETLDQWERMLELPDEAVLAIPGTTEERRLAIIAKLLRPGGQNASFYVTLAAACGYTVTVDDSFRLLVLRAGFRAGARCYGTPWAHTWQVDVQPPGGPALSHAELEAIIRRAAPLHTVTLFVYL